MTASEFKLLSYILDYQSNYNDRVQRGLKPKYKEILSDVRTGKVPGLTFADAERIEKVLPRECRIYPKDEITPLSYRIISNKLSDEFKSRLHRLEDLKTWFKNSEYLTFSFITDATNVEIAFNENLNFSLYLLFKDLIIMSNLGKTGTINLMGNVGVSKHLAPKLYELVEEIFS